MPADSAKASSGWPALVGGGLMNIALGTYYAWSVFVPSLEKEFGWTRTQTSLVPTIDMMTLASMFLLAGYLQRRLGSRVISVIGGVFYCLGLFLASFVHSLPMLYLTWGLMVGVGTGFGYLPPITVGANWFPHHRGLVNGLAIGIFAAGSGIFGPIAGALTANFGWRVTFQILAAVFFVFTMIGAVLLKDPPRGYEGPASKSNRQGRPRTHHIDTPTSEMIRQPIFGGLWIAYAMGAAAGTMVISQLVPFARQAGFSAQTAAFALTIGAVGSASGRILSGWMSDHFGRLRTLRTIVLTSMVVTPALYLLRQNLAAFYVLLFFVYYCYGTQLSVYTALSGDFWGTKFLGSNYGVLLLAWGFAGIIGPMLGARVFVATGVYQLAFFGSAGLACAALLILSAVRNPQEVTVAPTVSATA
jgi:OFA family oxalate/formate antiporter-like MFS transporter